MVKGIFRPHRRRHLIMITNQPERFSSDNFRTVWEHADEVRVLTVTKENLWHFSNNSKIPIYIFSLRMPDQDGWVKRFHLRSFREMSAFLKTSTLIGARLSKIWDQIPAQGQRIPTFTHRICRFLQLWRNKMKTLRKSSSVLLILRQVRKDEQKQFSYVFILEWNMSLYRGVDREDIFHQAAPVVAATTFFQHENLNFFERLFSEPPYL